MCPVIRMGSQYSCYGQKYLNVDFLHPLIMSMTQDDPSKRPNATEALRQWREIKSRVSFIRRLSRLREPHENRVQSTILDIISFVRICMLISSRAYKYVMGALRATRRASSL
jgi:hypothetical protein